MKQIIIFAALLVFCSHLFAQNSVENILVEIEKNNTTLSAIRKSIDAEKIGNKTGIYLQNPEVAFNYLWGNPSGIGNRTDFSIKQSFDFPTAYSYKNQISDLKNEQAELEYIRQLKSIRLEAKLICSDLVYTNALLSELKKRVAHAQQIASSYKSKFDTGDTNILEYNKAKLNLLNASKALEAIEIEQNTLLSELTRLNGGHAIAFNASFIQIPTIPAEFDQWFVSAEQNNPVLIWLKKELEISEKQVGLNKALGLPKFQAGYMSEAVVGEQFQGVTVGVSIPLWENKNTVKYAKAKSIAIQNTTTDTKLQFYNQLKIRHTKLVSLQKNVADYRNQFADFNNTELLQKAFDKGEISLTEYLYELSVYYETTSKLLELEKELLRTFVELNNVKE